MNIRATCERRFSLPIPPEAALPLFTPEGERSWAGADWAPSYPVPGADGDDSAPGTVFTTQSHGAQAIWIVTGRRADGFDYARVVPGRFAGTISVTCAPAGDPGACEVSVTYDVTSLGADGVAFVQELRRNYDTFIDGWRDEILAAVADG